ncbi:MAG: ABC transporter permease [Chloroflexota bacterium]
MNIQESFLTAIDSLNANKLRAVLTMLGVIIGVAAVIALLALGNGFSNSITEDISALGTNLVSISTDPDNSDGYPALSLDDVEALQDPLNATAVSAVAASVQGQQLVVYGGESMQTAVSGITANYLELNNLNDFQLGDGLTEADIDDKARVAVIGAGIASDLFGSDYPVGQQVKINGVGYEVVGVMIEAGGGIAGNIDENVYIPLTTAQTRLYPDRTRSGERAVSAITVQAASGEEVDLAITQVTETLRRQHNLGLGEADDFTIFDQSSLLETADSITSTLTTFLGAIAGISLVVGGIGIMNIMLVSVTERTREIGVRKAIGALKRDILVQFLLEAVLLSLLGGIIGILLGGGLSIIGGSLLEITAVIEPSVVALSAGFAAAVGLIFGIYPAWRAAGLRPIEALRYE